MRKKLAIIVPYRNRKKHLDIFLNHVIGFLETKGPYQHEIIVVEQDDDELFNRGALLNAGAVVAMRKSCTELCFHDVDLIPETVDYSIDPTEFGPIQLASKIVSLDGREEHLPYDYFGGVTKVSLQDFKKVDGYSNLYEGWGFEDADFLERCARNRCITDYEVPCPVTHGSAVYFSGKKGITTRNVDLPIKFAKEKNRQLILYADFIPGYPEKAVGYEDMRLVSICTRETDLGLSFDRYGCCRFTAWDNKYNQINIVTDKVPRIHQRLVGVLDFEENLLSLYRNGELIESKTLQTTRDIYYDPESISIGMSNNWNKGKRDYFTGDLLEAGIIVTSGKEGDFLKEFSIGKKKVTDLGPKDFVKAYNIDDLDGRKGTTTTTTTIQEADQIGIGVPLISSGVFKCLSHKDSKFDQPEVQRNQDRYFRVMRREIKQDEGLSTIKELYNISIESQGDLYDRLTWVKVTKK